MEKMLTWVKFSVALTFFTGCWAVPEILFYWLLEPTFSFDKQKGIF
jgi:hypothetical protein